MAKERARVKGQAKAVDCVTAEFAHRFNEFEP